MRSIFSIGLDWSSLDFLALVLRTSACPILFSTIELLARPEIFDDDGLMSWEIDRLRHPLLTLGWTGRAFDAVMRHTSFVLLLWLRAFLAGVVLIAPASWLLNPALVASITGLLMLSAKRSTYGQDGADQMQLIVWIAALAAVTIGVPQAAPLCLWFIAFQTCMAYTVAGISKLRASGWRRGEFLPGVLGTTIYGTKLIGGLLRHHRRLALAASWLVLSFEVSFPLAWLLPWPWGASYLALGCAFHVANTFLMGLGNFLLTFLATYPAVWFTLQRKGW
jgi:hypothetical protein